MTESTNVSVSDYGIDRRYAAFISYSHKDEKFAAWLHRAVESYRLPKDIAGQSAKGGDRIAPVFRDEEELPAASDLTKEIQDALRASEALIVICSPAAVDSPWVEKEIQFFSSLGRTDKVFAIIASGEPHAGDPRRECLPCALRQTGKEVLAPDASIKGEPRRAAVLKLIGGLHGLTLGQLVERDALRRRAQRLRIILLASAVLAIASALTFAWRAESRRAALEERARLLAQARAAFEDGHPEQGMTALAGVWPGLSAAEQAQYELVVDAWLSTLPDIRGAVAKLRRNSVFRFSKRLFFFDGQSVLRLPYAASVLATVDSASHAAYGIFPSGQVTEWIPGVGPAELLAEDKTAWSQVLWKEGVALRGGTVLFSGDLDADQLSEQLPVLLVIRPSVRRWHFIDIETDYFGPNPNAGLFLSQDCRILAWMASPKPLAGHNQELPAEIVTTYRLRLDDQFTSVERLKGKHVDGLVGVRVENGVDFLSNFAGRCSDSAVSSLREGRMPDLTLPLSSAKNDAINDASIQRRNDRNAQLDAFVDLGDHIQRGRFDFSDGHTSPTDRDYIAGSFPAQAFSFVPADKFNAIEYAVGHQTPGGYDRWIDEFICVSRKSALNPICLDLKFHRMMGSRRIYPRFVYVPGGRVPDDPMFILVSLPNLKPVEFRDAGLAGEFGVDGAATALSPSQAHFALVSSGQILLFNLSSDLKATLSARFDVPALAGHSEIDGSPAFVGESGIAIARPDGLVVLMDLSTKQEMWRFRIPDSGGSSDSKSRVEVVSSEDASWLAVHGNDFAAAVDSRSGLPLRHPVRKYFHGETGPVQEANTDACGDAYFVGHCFALPLGRAHYPNASLLSKECVRRYPLRRCFDRLELTEIFDRATRPIGNWLRKAPDASMVAEVAPEEWDILLDPIRRQKRSERDSQLHYIRCRSGWMIDRTRLTRFDALAPAVEDGHAVAVRVIGEKCGL